MVRELASAYQGAAAHWDSKSYKMRLSCRSVTGARACERISRQCGALGFQKLYKVHQCPLGNWCASLRAHIKAVRRTGISKVIQGTSVSAR